MNARQRNIAASGLLVLVAAAVLVFFWRTGDDLTVRLSAHCAVDGEAFTRVSNNEEGTGVAYRLVEMNNLCRVAGGNVSDFPTGAYTLQGGQLQVVGMSPPPYVRIVQGDWVDEPAISSSTVGALLVQAPGQLLAVMVLVGVAGVILRRAHW